MILNTVRDAVTVFRKLKLGRALVLHRLPDAPGHKERLIGEFGEDRRTLRGAR